MVGIVGLGLIGGSLALALRARGITVLGTDACETERRHAAEAGVHVVHDLVALAAYEPHVVVLAVPLGALRTVTRALLPLLPAHIMVVHTAGLQRDEATGLDARARARVIGTHPLAGSHGAGFAAARSTLFAGATVVVDERADGCTRDRLAWLWREAGAATVAHRAAASHDRDMAWVSHLPQLVATALAATLADAGIDPAGGGPGLHDTTRLAASPLPLWRDLLHAAPPDTHAALASMTATLDRLRVALADRHDPLLTELWSRGQGWRTAQESLR